MSRVAYLLVALLVCLVCQPSNGNVLKQKVEANCIKKKERNADDVRKEILCLTDRMKKTVEDSDPDALANLYDEGVVVMANGHPTSVGLNILKRYLGYVKDTLTISIYTEQIEVLGSDYALQRGKYKSFALDGTVSLDGTVLLLWKKNKNGKGWKIALDMYNNDP